MYHSKLIEILKGLTKKDLKDIEKFIEHNFSLKSEESVKTLFAYLKKQHPIFEASKIERHYVYEIVFRKEAFNEKKFNYLKTNLTKAIEDFLSYTQYLEIKEQSNYFLVQAYQKRGLAKLLMPSIREEKKKLEAENSLKDEMYLLHRYLYEVSTLSSPDKIREINDSDSIFETIAHLDTFYISAKLKLLAKAYNDQLPQSETIWLAADILKYLEENPALLDEPAIKVYKQIILLIQNSNDFYYAALIECIEKNKHFFQPYEADKFYLYALNYLINKFNTGQLTYASKLIELFQLRIDSGMYDLHYGEFISIAKWGAIGKNFEQTEKFIADNLSVLAEEIQDTIYYYCQAILLYAQNRFKDAIAAFNFVKFISVEIEADTRVIAARCYLEIEEPEMARYFCERLRVLINKAKKESGDKGIIDNKPLEFGYYEANCKYIIELSRMQISNKRKSEEQKEQFINDILTNPYSGGKSGWLYKTAARLLKIPNP